ncbi:MAG: MerR family transcriptional regulator [Rhodospirillales bacterium]|nr:MerR family transcriptional regulator [Rhodospirillales bacterium]
MTKSPTAFRTIAEVASELDLPAHVLRFWESKFTQIKPLKRGGGRRYYRPEDVVLLRRIRSLLYTEGYTIKGVQRLLREGVGKSVTAESAGERFAAAKVSESAADVDGQSDEPADQPAASEAASGRGAGDDASGKPDLRALLHDLEALRALLRRAGT